MKKRYRDGKGAGSQTPRPFVLTKQWDKKGFQEMRAKVIKQVQKENPQANTEKADIKVKEKLAKEEPEFKMHIPGQKVTEPKASGKILI